MHKNTKIIVITIMVTILSIVLVYNIYSVLKIQWNTVITNDKTVSTYNSSIINTMQKIDKIWINNNTYMDISIKDVFKYWNKWGNLIWYFDSKWYDTVYLFWCKYINKFIFDCPIDWFNNFSSQFYSTWSILYNSWTNTYFENNSQKINIYSKNTSLLFILDKNEDY